MKRILLHLLLVLLISGAVTTGAGASSGSVAVSLPGLTDGQTIGGVVTLSVLIAAPEPIRAVEYFLDEGLVAKVVLAPYNYDWDTTNVTRGMHSLSARATDRAGNTGQAQVRVNIVRPIELTVSAPREVIPIGEKIKLNVDITALNGVAQIDLIVDNQVLSSAQTPPFNLSLDTRQLQAGLHIVTIRAMDSKGEQARASIPLRFEAPPEDYTWLRVLIVLGLIATAVAAGFAVWRTIKVVKRSYRRTCRVELRNLGNVPTRYELLADDPVSTLKFRLMLNGALLPQEPLTKPVTQSAEGAAQPASTGRPAGVREKGRILGDIAQNLGAILPGSVGRQLMQWGAGMRHADFTVQRAEYAGQQARSLGGSKSTASPSSAPAGSAPSLVLTPGAWSTPYLQPGDAVALNLIIDPGRLAQTQDFTFRVSSRAIDPAEEQALMETAHLQVEGVSLLKFYLPFFIIAGVTIAVIVVIAIILANTGLLG